MTWNDGRIYVGDHTADQKHGHGCFLWADGRQYCGQWKSGKQDGSGLYMSSKQQVRAGIWSDGNRISWTSDERQPQSSDGWLSLPTGSLQKQQTSTDSGVSAPNLNRNAFAKEFFCGV